MSKGDTSVARGKVGDLLPPREMISAQSMSKHNCWTAAGPLVVDLGARVLNEAARNCGRISGYASLLFLRLCARRYKESSSRDAGEFREIATRNHGLEICIVDQSAPALDNSNWRAPDDILL